MTDRHVDHLLQALALDVEPPTAALRDRVLGAATEIRRPGRSVHGVRPSELLDALRRQADDLHALLDDLTPDAWRASVDERWTVHHLAAHLVAVFRYASANLGHGDFVAPPGTEAEHVKMTEPTVEALVREPVETTKHELRVAIDALLTQLDGRDLSDRITVYGADWAVQTMVAVRVFEVWAHAEDMRRAAGIAPLDPTPADLSLLCVVLVLSLPGGLNRIGAPRPDDTVKVVLTGTGGATFTARLGPAAPATSSATVVAEAIDFCRLAAGGITPDDLLYDAEGDVDVVRDLLWDPLESTCRHASLSIL